MRYALVPLLLVFVAAAQAGTPPSTPTQTAIGSPTPTPASEASPNVTYEPAKKKHHKHHHKKHPQPATTGSPVSYDWELQRVPSPVWSQD